MVEEHRIPSVREFMERELRRIIERLNEVDVEIERLNAEKQECVTEMQAIQAYEQVRKGIPSPVTQSPQPVTSRVIRRRRPRTLESNVIHIDERIRILLRGLVRAQQTMLLAFDVIAEIHDCEPGTIERVLLSSTLQTAEHRGLVVFDRHYSRLWSLTKKGELLGHELIEDPT